jgi:enoyl-CoA hydratase
MSVHFLKSGNAGIITLDRPDALHALSIEMVQQMTARLLEWQEDHEVGHIIISATGQRAFCSGGDVRQAVSYVQAESNGFFRRALFSDGI